MSTKARTATASHTPGPWKTDPEFDHQVVLGSDGAMLADCSIMINPKYGDRSDAINKANARLVAAAPDLLAALYQIAQGGNVARTDWPAFPAIDRESMCDIARAAIAKATGAA